MRGVGDLDVGVAFDVGIGNQSHVNLFLLLRRRRRNVLHRQRESLLKKSESDIRMRIKSCSLSIVTIRISGCCICLRQDECGAATGAVVGSLVGPATVDR